MKDEVDLYYFSGTGNTRLAAAAARDAFVTKDMPCRLKEITNIATAEHHADGKLLGLAFPVYGLREPKIIERFINTLPPQEEGRAFIIANAHSNTGQSINRVGKLLEKKGYGILGAVETFTPSSSIITEETEGNEAGEILRKKAGDSVRDFVLTLGESAYLLPGNPLSVKERMLASLFRAVMPGPVLKSARATDKCKSCAQCAADCPVENIRMEEGRPVWGRNCETCMRCINLCPSDAIEMMKSAGRTRYKGGLL